MNKRFFVYEYTFLWLFKQVDLFRQIQMMMTIIHNFSIYM